VHNERPFSPRPDRTTVEIWSDVVCPWCYIGKRRFERAVTELDAADDIDIVWRSFQLHPEQPPGRRQRHDEYLAQRTGRSLDEVRLMNDRVIELAAAEGLAYDFDRYTVVNTLDAHRIAHLAASRGLGSAIQERLLRGQLVEGEVLDDPGTLIRLAADVGVAAADTEAVLNSDAYAADVRTDIQTGSTLGLTGVPFFVFDRSIGVSGAQPTEVFSRALTMASSAVRPQATP
jgi:predicted DsbA family dithiol-disulfide isomerase